MAFMSSCKAGPNVLNMRGGVMIENDALESYFNKYEGQAKSNEKCQFMYVLST
jgi:hypothetical protein